MRYGRLHNFSSGPAALPESVLEQIRDELLNYQSFGCSVLEMSHRSKPFDRILEKATTLVRQLLGVNDQYEVLFLQGGASLQFAMVPMNLGLPGKPIEVLHTGYWTDRALAEIRKDDRLTARVLYDGEATRWTTLPDPRSVPFTSGASYAYFCSNNTIEGTQFHSYPQTGNVPLVADFSSDFLSRQIPVQDFGLIFAGAQKNLGPSGVTLVILRKDLLDRCDPKVPTMLQYRTHAEGGSRYNTPPAFGIYVCGLVLEWIEKNGGLAAMEQRNHEKAQLLYSTIDSSGGFYHCPVAPTARSEMNIVWRIKPHAPDGKALEETFVKDATAAGLLELKGHRAVGGLRASLYNAQPLEGVQALTAFMREFQRKNG